MDQFHINLIINLSIGVLFIFGLCWFMLKRTNWLKEGGIIYEFLKARRENKNSSNIKKKNQKK